MADAQRDIGARIADALAAACEPAVPMAVWGAGAATMGGRAPPHLARLRDDVVVAAAPAATAVDEHVGDLVVQLFDAEGVSLVRLAALFVDDRDAAEDLVQEAFIRFARNIDRVADVTRAPAYLRSIVLNLARDHNRRGLVTLRHRSTSDPDPTPVADRVVLGEERQRVIDALRDLPSRQRTCLVLRYYEELGVDEIADVLSISRNSVKTHLRRGLGAMRDRL